MRTWREGGESDGEERGRVMEGDKTGGNRSPDQRVRGGRPAIGRVRKNAIVRWSGERGSIAWDHSHHFGTGPFQIRGAPH